MNTGCPDCDKSIIKFPWRLCPKHELEQLKYEAITAQKNYEEAKTEYEQKQERNQK